ncbi:flagellar basal body rod protein FlgC [Alienimonas californiensis]|uniref:Flagellar basal-body rod protein FlgC n=1 Tax=Alienimonas californiensis TaxID=2527989 RepID=A0A517PE49_9PLAN|nr:flagellar basal body rod protein FlgC [Alienimonas californiensis]QDT17644.1 Flagellar basal-body rod protein FlgC [Alienimonas californiensis]
MFQAFDVSTTALVAQRARLDTIAGNVANANSTRNEAGEAEPFRRRFVQFAAADMGFAGDGSAQAGARTATGVQFEVKTDETTPLRAVHAPGHPDAGPDGMLMLPNVDLTSEFVNAVEAARAYEANVTAVELSKQLAEQSLRILG